MSKPIAPISSHQLVMVDLAVANLRAGAKLLRDAGATRSLARARAAIKSAEGAQRHAYHRFNRMPK